MALLSQRDCEVAKNESLSPILAVLAAVNRKRITAGESRHLMCSARAKKNMFLSENGMSEEINIMSRFLYIIMCNNLTTTEFRLIALSPREVISF